MSNAFTRDDYAELLQRLRAATDEDITAILSNNFNVVLGALAALPLIRAATLEEAAQVADDHAYTGPGDAYWIATKIRALKQKPSK